MLFWKQEGDLEGSTWDCREYLSPSGGKEKRDGIVKDTRRQIRTMLKYEDSPTVLVVHIGGNDIGLEKTKDLCDQLKRLFDWINLLMPDTVLIWSQILPRFKWRYTNNNVAMERSRNIVNTSVASYMTKTKNGCYIRSPEIKANETFLEKDGVHLAPMGNNIFFEYLARRHRNDYQQSGYKPNLP